MTLEGRIKRLERERDHPAHSGPDPETVKHWASLWIEAGVEESRATALALEFLEYCQATGQEVAFSTLMKWERGGEDDISERIRDVELSLELRPEELSNK
jgi:hypothetical protein